MTDENVFKVKDECIELVNSDYPELGRLRVRGGRVVECDCYECRGECVFYERGLCDATGPLAE